MTFSIVARCPDTGSLGVAVSTYAHAVGGRCPLVDAAAGAISCQAYTEPRLRARALRALAGGGKPEAALAALAAEDEFFAFRQLSLVDRSGHTAAHSGDQLLPWAGHEVGDGFVVAGNHLAGPHVLAAMSGAYRQQSGVDLPRRLLAALAAASDVGAQVADYPEDLRPIAERSAALIVHAVEPYPNPMIDLRVDVSPGAVAELRDVLEAFLPVVPLVRDRAIAPTNIPPEGHYLGLPDSWPSVTTERART